MKQGAWWQLYEFLTRRSKPTKHIVRMTAQASSEILSRIFRFTPGIDLVTANSMLLGIYEAGTVALCERIVRPRMTVADIGAHTGYYTRLFARLVGSKGRVYAFEPHPTNFATLERNTKHLTNVIRIPMAVGAAEGECVLYESSISSGRHSLVEGRDRGFHTRRFNVMTTSLNSFFHDIDVEVMKLDVEGGELDVLRGAGEVLSKANSINLIVEFVPAVQAAGGSDPSDLPRMLQGFGFEVYAVDEFTGKAIPIETFQTLEAFTGFAEKSTKRRYLNLFASRGAPHG